MRRVYVIGAVVLGFAAGAVLGAAFVGNDDAQAQTASGGDVGLDAIQRIVIEEGYHHLGDDYQSCYQNPDPEDTVWSKQVSIGSVRGNVAYITLSAVDVHNAAQVVVNGYAFSLPYSGGCMPQNVVLTVPAQVFRAGPNTVSLEALWRPLYGSYDDFEFGELVVYFN